MARHHDLLIIGTGSGNSLVTPELAHLDIAIAEKGAFGGTCLNVGCIPTKMFVYPADVVEQAMHAARLGVTFPEPQVRWREVRDRVFGRIDAIAAGGEDYRRTDPKVTVYGSHVRFTGEREVTTEDGEVITADRVVVAAGARPVMLKIEGLDHVDPERGVHTSDTIMRMDSVPERVVVIGGGFIAAEMAHVLGAFGARITWLQRSDRLLRSDDETISEIFTDVQAKRFDLRLHTQVQAARREGEVWHLDLSDGSTVECDAVLVAIGRRPNSDLVDAAAGGLELAGDRIVVDEYQRTSVEGVWALGDISSPYQLKHVANHEARVVAHNLAHPDDLVATNHDVVPSATFGYPQVASFGPTQAELDAAGRRYVVKEQAFGDTAYGWAMEDSVGLCKLIADPDTRQIIAAHVIGYQASNLLQPLVQAASLGTPVPDVARGQYWIHPALMEVVENALLGLEL